jgi:hypothetical protein
VHEEHAALSLEAGVYSVVRQREFDYRPQAQVRRFVAGD